jgi:glycosyltransferase involved in cell wall biosynthesis
MRIALISHLADNSGACRYLQSIARHLQGTRYQPVVVLPSPGPMERSLNDINVPYLIIKKDPGKTKGNPQGPKFKLLSIRLPTILFFRVKYIIELALWLRKEKVDIVWINTVANSSGFLAARIAGVPSIWRIAEGIEIGFTRPIHKFRIPFLKSANRIVTVSEYNKRILTSLGIHPERITVVHNGIDLSVFQPPVFESKMIRESFKISEKDILVGAVQLISPLKGTLEFIQTAGLITKSHPDLHFIVVGSSRGNPSDIEYFDLVKKTVAELGLGGKVHFVGWQQDVRPWISAMDIFVLPSYAESFPISILEAMALSKPVVATDVGGISELVVQGKSGLLFTPVNIQEMSESIKRLVEDCTFRDELGKAGRVRVENNFNIEMKMHDLVNILNNA